ncbi:MAG: protein translocase SEC61 complex subunit gamma [Candidatus Aenigmarchaeota archaeon]|nr:protein translocase SEC61 complex subunit gamma [Candidatus Aenigmarchaeota archaeon]
MKLDIKSKITEWKRILQVARKPGKDEYLSSTRICVIGIVVIGIIGFAIFLLFAFLGL